MWVGNGGDGSKEKGMRAIVVLMMPCDDIHIV